MLIVDVIVWPKLPKSSIVGVMFYFQKQSSSKTFIDSLNKWSAVFEEVDPLLRFEQINLEEVSWYQKWIIMLLLLFYFQSGIICNTFLNYTLQMFKSRNSFVSLLLL